jgi:hypothetical protein
MKLKLILAVLIVLSISGLGMVSQVSAADDNSLSLDSSLQTTGDTGNSMSWPVLPHESLNDVARMFYPKNKFMQQQFVAKTLRLNADNGATVNPAARSNEASLLVIPTLKSLSHAARANKLAAKKLARKKPRKQKMQMSYRIKELVERVPASLVKEYEYLVGKNAFLKEELDKLNKKLGFLQAKVEKLTLIFDKTFSLPADNLATKTEPDQAELGKAEPDKADLGQAVSSQNVPPADNAPQVASATGLSTAGLPTPGLPMQALPAQAAPARKVFKNLSEKPQKPSMSDQAISVILQSSNDDNADFASGAGQEPEGTVLNSLNKNLLIAAMVLVGLAMLGSHLLRKYRQRMYAQFSLATTPMEDSQMDFGGYWEDTKQQDDVPQHKPSAPPAVKLDAIPDTVQQTAPVQKPALAFPNTEARAIKTQADVTLQTAKLLMNANRSQDAMSHLKESIEAQPKGSIEHWLYLLEIFRKLKLKVEFESYAERLHQTFNVMTPVWYESKSSNVSMIVPQFLEEFPHIMAKLYTEWPSKFATEYLRSLIADNREGIRAGFCKGVLDEILCLISLLETRKEFE